MQKTAKETNETKKMIEAGKTDEKNLTKEKNQNDSGEGILTRQDGSRLLSWYWSNARDLPWRHDTDPYHVWVSEIMLQQTRVEAAKDYYLRFLEAFPNVRALAESEEDQCLKLWEGLGYYSRCRNLRKAAQVVVRDLNGKIPDDVDALRRLPGVGPYTAAAIASISGGRACPAVDGNLLRIFSRLTRYPDEVSRPAARKACAACFQPLMRDLDHPQDPSLPIDPDSPGAVNQALMDLGALVCLPNAMPRCGECPFQELCLAHAKREETDFPRRPAKKKRPVTEMTVFLILCNGGVLLRRRPPRGLLAGLFEFPNVPGQASRRQALDYVTSLGLTPVRIRPLPPARHVFSHREWQMTGYAIFVDGWSGFSEKDPEGQNLFLASRDELDNKWSVPSAFSAYREELRRLPMNPE